MSASEVVYGLLILLALMASFLVFVRLLPKEDLSDLDENAEG